MRCRERGQPVGLLDGPGTSGASVFEPSDAEAPLHRCRALPRIERITVHRLQARLHGVFRIAYAAAATVESIVAEVVLSDGTRGWGEAAPAPRVTQENTASVEAYIEAAAGKLAGLELPDGLGEALRRVHAGAPGFSSARAALESALLDATARTLGTPVYTLLGGRVHKGLETDYTVSIPGPETLEEIRRSQGSRRDAFIEAVEYLVGLRSRAPEEPGFPLPAVRGFRVLKVKLGTGSTEDDVLLAETVYEASRGKARIRIDANQAWTRKQAIHVIRRLERSLGTALELVEQPVPASRLEDLAVVRDAVETPVASDESTRSPEEIARAATLGAVDAVNIKIAKIGGPLQAAHAAAMLEAHGLEAMWGCMVETGLGISQAVHPALTSPATRYVDLDAPLFLEEDPVENPPAYRPEPAGVMVYPPEGPGLGPRPRSIRGDR